MSGKPDAFETSHPDPPAQFHDRIASDRQPFVIVDDVASRWLLAGWRYNLVVLHENRILRTGNGEALCGALTASVSEFSFCDMFSRHRTDTLDVGIHINVGIVNLGNQQRAVEQPVVASELSLATSPNRQQGAN